MFLNKEDFANAVRTTPLISLDFIIENEFGEFLVGKRTNRPAQEYWFVPGGRVLKDETLEQAFMRLTEEEIGQQFPITHGQFLVSGSTFMRIIFLVLHLQRIMWCWVFD